MFHGILPICLLLSKRDGSDFCVTKIQRYGGKIGERNARVNEGSLLRAQEGNEEARGGGLIKFRCLNVKAPASRITL